MFRYKVFVLLILMLKVCSAKPQAVTSKTTAQMHAQTLQQKTNNTAVSSYFRQDPYGPNTYAFGYEVDDRNTNNVQFRDERRYLNGTIVGSYGYVRPDGRITLTRYLADKEHGFHSHTDLFKPGEEKKVAAARWPSPASDMKSTNTNANQQHNQQHMLTPDVIKAVKEQHGIDLSNKDISHNLPPHHDPTIADIVNGEVPLSLLGDNKSSVVGFETVNKFIPNDFPIVPFELPTHLEHHAAVQEATTHNNYDQAKQNNAEKTIPSELLKTHADSGNEQVQHAATTHNLQAVEQHEQMLQHQEKPPEYDARQHHLYASTPKSLVDTESEQGANGTWYHKVINEARKEFLQNLPSLE